MEVKIGDGIVFASSTKAASSPSNLGISIWRWPATSPQGGKLVANPYTNWKQIDASSQTRKSALALPASTLTLEHVDLDFAVWLSSAVEKIDFLVGIVVLRPMSTVVTLPSVSIPSDSGVT